MNAKYTTTYMYVHSIQNRRYLLLCDECEALVYMDQLSDTKPVCTNCHRDVIDIQFADHPTHA